MIILPFSRKKLLFERKILPSELDLSTQEAMEILK